MLRSGILFLAAIITFCSLANAAPDVELGGDVQRRDSSAPPLVYVLTGQRVTVRLYGTRASADEESASIESEVFRISELSMPTNCELANQAIACDLETISIGGEYSFTIVATPKKRGQFPIVRRDLSGQIEYLVDPFHVYNDVLMDSDGDGVGDYDETLEGFDPDNIASTPPVPTIDVLTVTSHKFEDEFGAETLGVVESAFTSLNAAMAGSGVEVIFRVVAHRSIEINGSESIVSDEGGVFSRASQKIGEFAEIDSWYRDAGADLAVFFVYGTSGFGGAGALPGLNREGNLDWYANSADGSNFVFSMVNGRTNIGYVLAHEIGHNMGLGHYRNDFLLPTGTFDYAVGLSGLTIMGQGPNNLYSSPALTCSGGPCGVDRDIAETGADAAFALKATRYQVSRLSEVTSGPVYSAVLPSSRSVQAGQEATFFGSIVNAGSLPLLNCEVSSDDLVDVDFSFQQTNPLTNEEIYFPNVPMNVGVQGECFSDGSDLGECAATGSRSFRLTLRPNTPFPSTQIGIQISCDDGLAVDPIPGINSVQLSSTQDPGADVIALVASETPGRVLLTEGAAAFSLAIANVGVAGNVSVAPRTNAPVGWSICNTDPLTSACLQDPTSDPEGISIFLSAGGTSTFAVFVSTVEDSIPFDPAQTRIWVDIHNQDGDLVGSTSIAVSR